MNRAEIFLPWPDKRLSPNARVHWASLASAKKKAKEVAYYTTLGSGVSKVNADAVSVRYSFFPPSRRAYDLDNLVASMKAAADGIALAIGVDDSKWDLAISPRGPVEKNGMVKVEIEWPPFTTLANELATAEAQRDSELHPGLPELQQHWDAYLDAVDLARRSGEPSDAITAARLYLTYAKARDEQERAL